MMLSPLTLMIGLGNPGPQYCGHRHNVGFMAVEAIARRHHFASFRSRFQAAVSEGALNGERVLLIKPLTYMNESGRAVSEAVRFFKLAPEDVIVFHDELDLAPGKLRVKTGGGVAGHNGLRSIGAHIGPNFRRVRIGVGHPGDKDRVLRHVLADFAKADQSWREPLLDAVADNAGLLLSGDDAGFMNKVALAVQPPKPRLSNVEHSMVPIASANESGDER